MVITLPNLANYFMQRNLTTSHIKKAPLYKPDQNIVRALKQKQNVDDRFGRGISLKCDCHPIKKRWNVWETTSVVIKTDILETDKLDD